MFSKTQDEQLSLRSKPVSSRLQSTESVGEQLDLESNGGGVTPDAQQLAYTR